MTPGTANQCGRHASRPSICKCTRVSLQRRRILACIIVPPRQQLSRRYYATCGNGRVGPFIVGPVVTGPCHIQDLVLAQSSIGRTLELSGTLQILFANWNVTRQVLPIRGANLCEHSCILNSKYLSKNLILVFHQDKISCLKEHFLSCLDFQNKKFHFSCLDHFLTLYFLS